MHKQFISNEVLQLAFNCLYLLIIISAVKLSTFTSLQQAMHICITKCYNYKHIHLWETLFTFTYDEVLYIILNFNHIHLFSRNLSRFLFNKLSTLTTFSVFQEIAEIFLEKKW